MTFYTPGVYQGAGEIVQRQDLTDKTDFFTDFFYVG